MGSKEEANQIGSSNPNQIHSSSQQDLPSRALESFVPLQVGVCRICLAELFEDTETLKMDCGCKGGLAPAHLQCALDRIFLKGNKCDICRQDVHNLSFGPTADQMVVTRERMLAARGGRENGVCRICLAKLFKDSHTLRMECGCESGLPPAYVECALDRIFRKGNKCDVYKQDVHDLSFAPTVSQMIVAGGGRMPEGPSIDRWNRDKDELLRLILVASLAYFCVIETLTVWHYGFTSTLESLPYSVICSVVLGTMTSWTSTALVWSKYVWVYAAAQFGLVLLSAHFIPGHPKEPPVAFPTSAWNVIGVSMASSLVTIFCCLMIDCSAEIRLNIAAKRRDP